MNYQLNWNFMDPLNFSYFLPNRFKKIGWLLIAIHLSIILALLFLIEIVNVLPVSNTAAVIVHLFEYTLMIGLVLVISSREKEEDELIRLIRLKSFQYGLYLAVCISIFLSVMTRFPGIEMTIQGLWIYPATILTELDTISATLLYIVGFYQFKLYRLRNDEE